MNIKKLLVLLAFLAPLPTALAEMVLDTVLATVDDKPITLSDLTARLGGKKVSLDNLRENQEARAAIDTMILDKIVTLEAESKGMQASPPEIEAYIEQVAAQNKMSRSQFEIALSKGGKSIESYRSEVATEVLKGKLISSELRRSIVITDEEAKGLVRKAKGASADSGKKITLRSLLVSTGNLSSTEFQEKVQKVKKAIEEDGFEDAVDQFSDDASNKESGGLIGEFAETELEPVVYQAVSYLKEGEVSEPVSSSLGTRFFYVESRSETPTEENFSNQDLTQAKEFLRQRKMQDRMASYITNDLVQKHTIERKF